MNMATKNNMKTFNLADNTIYIYIYRQITIVNYYL